VKTLGKSNSKKREKPSAKKYGKTRVGKHKAPVYRGSSVIKSKSKRVALPYNIKRRKFLESKLLNINSLTVADAKYLHDYVISITFSDGENKKVDFTKSINSTKGYYTKYKTPRNFKSFKIEDGNIVWGKDWDLIFEIKNLYLGLV